MPKLTALSVKQASKPGRIGDGYGLWLQVRSAQHKSWLFRYRMGGREMVMGLGPFPLVKLADARELAIDAGRLVRQGIDPITEREKSRVAAVGARTTFSQAAASFIATRGNAWRNAKHRAQWSATLEEYVMPVFGKKGVGTITAEDVHRVLDPIWNTKNETASRVRGRIKLVLDYAEARGWRRGENPAIWRDRLSKLFSDRAKTAPVKHHAALSWGDIGPFMVALRAQSGVAARALELVILTAARSGEVIGATWPEFNVAEKVWTVPGTRMKAGREHRVPLSAPALSLIDAMRPLRDAEAGDYLFPGGKIGRPLSNMAMTATLRRMKRGDITAHGFRSSFRDWCWEATDYPRELAEASLAHVLSNKVEAAYLRGDALKKRAALMVDWAAFCAASPDGATTATIEAPADASHAE